MIRTLQKKIVITAMAAISILLVILLSGINLINAWAITRETNMLLEILIKNESGQPPQRPGEDIRRHGFFRPPFTEDDKMSAVFFTVRFDSLGNVAQADVRRIRTVTEKEAEAMAQSVYEEGKTSGKTGHFRYTSISVPEVRGRIYLFMDVSAKYYAMIRVAALSVLAGVVCWGFMLLLVIFLSGKAVRPIAENMEKQKQFVTDAGHEIKTPLAIILANTEAMELHNGESKWSRNIREQVVRLNGLMQNLLTLAKSDEGKAPVGREVFSLSDAAADTLRMFSEPMNLKGVRVKEEIAPGVSICADKEQISQLLSILMDNAVKYSRVDGTIVFSLRRAGKGVILQIENTCEALPACEPDKLFDRFYRGDEARTQKSGGYGIGLSAAKAIAELHHGMICARYETRDRIIFTVKL